MPRLRGGGMGETWEDWGVMARGYEISFGADENVLKLILVMTAQLCEYTKTTELYTLNRWIYAMWIISVMPLSKINKYIYKTSKKI